MRVWHWRAIEARQCPRRVRRLGEGPDANGRDVLLLEMATMHVICLNFVIQIDRVLTDCRSQLSLHSGRQILGGQAALGPKLLKRAAQAKAMSISLRARSSGRRTRRRARGVNISGCQILESSYGGKSLVLMGTNCRIGAQ